MFIKWGRIVLTIRLKTRRSVVVMENGALKYGSNNNNNEILEEKVVSTFLASFLESFKLAIINTWTSQFKVTYYVKNYQEYLIYLNIL